MTTPDQSHIGKFVKFDYDGEKIIGKLLSCLDGTNPDVPNPALIRVHTGELITWFVRSMISNYELMNEPIDTQEEINDQAIRQISSPKLSNIVEPMTLENMTVGTLVKEKSGYKKVLADLGGDGELHTYILSEWGRDKNDDDLKYGGGIYTVFELKEYGCTIVNETEQVEVTLKEIAKMKGVDVSQIRVKE